MLELEKDRSIVDSDLEIYAKHLKNSSEDFNTVLFKDLKRMRVVVKGHGLELYG